MLCARKIGKRFCAQVSEIVLLRPTKKALVQCGELVISCGDAAFIVDDEIGATQALFT